MKLEKRVALITGGGTGIGAAIAKRFVEDGAKVCIVGRRQEHLDKVAETLPPGTVVKFPGDVSRPEDIKSMVEMTLTFGGKIDALVNCAAFNIEGGITEININDWQKSLDVNLTAPFLLMRAVIPHMIKVGGGSIINISSLAGIRCVPHRVAYCTSKAAIIMLTQQAAFDYGFYNIRCNAICPGPVKTSMTEKLFAELKERVGAEELFKNIPLRRPADSSEIASVCSFLASDDSSFMTGSVLVVDGGLHILDAFTL
jgi:NAD(P)-dependent dehydrogenase (short-subunit alcohol dehydrogenase family)